MGNHILKCLLCSPELWVCALPCVPAAPKAGGAPTDQTGLWEGCVEVSGYSAAWCFIIIPEHTFRAPRFSAHDGDVCGERVPCVPWPATPVPRGLCSAEEDQGDLGFVSSGQPKLCPARPGPHSGLDRLVGRGMRYPEGQTSG